MLGHAHFISQQSGCCPAAARPGPAWYPLAASATQNSQTRQFCLVPARLRSEPCSKVCIRLHSLHFWYCAIYADAEPVCATKPLAQTRVAAGEIVRPLVAVSLLAGFEGRGGLANYVRQQVAHILGSRFPRACCRFDRRIMHILPGKINVK